MTYRKTQLLRILKVAREDCAQAMVETALTLPVLFCDAAPAHLNLPV